MNNSNTEFITTPQTTRLVTLQEVERELGTGADKAAILTDMIDQASDDIMAYCHRDFGQARVKETWYIPPQGVWIGFIQSWVLYMTRPPVVTVHEVLDADDVVVPTTDYRIEGEKLRFFNSSPFSYGTNQWKVSVEYTGGYGLPGWEPAATPALPTTVTRATIMMVQQTYEVLGGTASDLTRESLADYAVVYGSQGRRMPGSVMDRLAPYRLVTV